MLNAGERFVKASHGAQVIGITQLGFGQTWIDFERPAIFPFCRRPIPIEKQTHVAKFDVGARQISIKLHGTLRRFFCSRHHLGWRTVIRGRRIVGFGQSHIETSVLGILCDTFLKVMNRFVHAFARIFAQLMQAQEVFVVTLEIDR